MVRKTVVPPLAERADLVPHPGPRLRVEAGRRLVEEEDLRAGGRCRGRRRAGGACRPSRCRSARSAAASRSSAARTSAARACRVRLGHPVQAALDDELAAAGLGRVGRAALRHVADALADELRLAPQVRAGDRRLARGRGDQRREHPERRRLAGAVRAEEAEDLAGADPQVDALDGLDRARRAP